MTDNDDNNSSGSPHSLIGYIATGIAGVFTAALINLAGTVQDTSKAVVRLEEKTTTMNGDLSLIKNKVEVSYFTSQQSKADIEALKRGGK